MEDLYDDLDNYEDVHALEELRAENKELKVKLEEHSAAMEKLQKEILQDYDNLKMAFKQLENNYSSLLMTARSEIERKTQRITQINTEKDMMVLDALKVGKNIRRNWTGGNNPGRMNQDRPVKGPKKNKEVNVKQKNTDIKQERSDQSVLSTKNAGPESSTYSSNKSAKADSVNVELFDNRKSNVNDNIAQHKTEVNEPPRTSASRIKDKRKSTTALRMPIDTFSSGDELERNHPTKDTRTENERRNINKMPIERNIKPSETSSVDERGHKPHESSSRESYRSRSSRQHDNSRDRDKYEVSLKYRKKHSPERGQKRPHREHQDDYPRPHREYQNDYPRKAREHQGEFSRQPRQHQDDHTRKPKEHLDNYPRQPKENQDDYTRKPREHLDDYPRQPRENQDDYTRKPRDHLDDYPRQPRENQDDYTRKPRDHSADHPRYERGRYVRRSLESPPPESYNRRQRTKSFHRSDHDRYPYDQEKNKHYYDDKYSTNYRSNDYDEPLIKKQRTESYDNPDAHSVDDRCYRDRESMDAQPIPVFSPHEYDMLRFSCQSPDSVHTDAAIAKPSPKEIMATAATPLDDPRVTSKRYVIQKQNGEETLSTVVGRNIDIRPISKAVWNIKPVDIPIALVRRPSHCSDQLVKDIYMDIDNPVTNLDVSLESGEVRGADDEIHEIRSKLKEIHHNTQDIKISKQASEDISKQLVKDETVSKPNIAKYRIPKIGQNNKDTHSKMDVPIIEVAENVPHHKKVSKKDPAEDSIPKELLTQKQQNNKHENFVHNNKNKVEDTKKLKSRERGEDKNQSTLSKMAIVADDLELSDDNSDHNDTGTRTVPEKVQIICEIPLINMLHSEARRNDSVNKIENMTVDSAHNTEIKSTVETAGIKDVVDEEKTKDSDSTKKQKTKKKKTKSKEVPKDSAETTVDPIHVPEKKLKSKKEKESTPKETKERFCDLFGDSSSLMTPEDLGIPSYLPISEDAQDAVDMKINQIIDDASLVDKDEMPGDLLPQNRVEVIIQETTAHDDIPIADLQKSNTEVEAQEIVQEIRNKVSSKGNEEILDTNQLPSPIIYENLNPGTDLNDPNIVKTIIISTGKQPEIAYETKIPPTKPTPIEPATAVEVNAIQNTNDTHLSATKREFKKDILKALATSTPHKEFTAVEADAAKADVVCDPSISKAVATITNVEPVVNQTENSTLESNDAPDVRIFVKRRRKVVKRPPMT